MLELEQGRPADTSGRLEKEIRVYDFLDKLGVIYDRVDHEALMTMEACEEADRVLEATICKNLFLCTANKKEFYLLMIVGDKRLVTKDVSKKLGTSRLSFANEAYMEEYLDITPGSVSVLGLMNDTENHVQLVIDEDVLKGEYVGCHPCINTSSLRVRTADLMKKSFLQCITRRRSFRFSRFLFALAQFPEKSRKHGRTGLLKNTSGNFHLMVKLLHLQKVQDRSCTSGFGIHGADDYPPHTGLYNCTGTHLTWLQCDVEVAVLKPPVTCFFTCFADGRQFCMGKRIFINVAPVISSCDDFTVLDNHTSNRDFIDRIGFFRLF